MNPLPDVLEVIDAFVDGERVEADALKNALADPDGRDHLVAAWLLREEMQDQMTRESFVPPVPRAVPGRVTSWIVAVSLAAACLVIGVGIGYRAGNHVPEHALLPQDARTLSPTSSPAPATQSFPVPAPTRVIQVEFHSSAADGGH